MTSEQERLEDEQFEQELAELRVKYKDFSIMDKHTFPELTLIWEGREYEPSEEEFELIRDGKAMTIRCPYCVAQSLSIMGFLSFRRALSATQNCWFDTKVKIKRGGLR